DDRDGWIWMDGKLVAWRDAFFFASRRRHTCFDCDWSSDVCSSDLPRLLDLGEGEQTRERHELHVAQRRHRLRPEARLDAEHVGRSEERRVGKEGRPRRAREQRGNSNEIAPTIALETVLGPAWMAAA